MQRRIRRAFIGGDTAAKMSVAAVVDIIGSEATNDPNNINSFPTEIQKQILQYADCSTLFNLRATNRNYNNIITNDVQDVWKARHDIRWPNSKRRRQGQDIAEWSRDNNWKLHAQGIIDEKWFQEFMRRCRLDDGVLDRLYDLESEIERDHTTKVCHQKPLWYQLMADGEDIVDRVKLIIRQHKSIWLGDPLDDVGDKVLTGISRCVAYQHWRYLHDPDTPPQTVEAGAIVIAKFYDDCSAVMKAKGLHCWETEVQHDLDKLAHAIKDRLDRRGYDTPYPMCEVITHTGYLFTSHYMNPNLMDEDGYGLPAPFRGNMNDYYNHTNSLINHCLMNKTGIPISLAVIYCAIIRRVCGVNMDIIGLPGHIVVGVPFNEGDPPSSRVFVDPFHNGNVLSYSDCQDIVARYNMTFREEMVQPIPNDHVWQRMIRNLVCTLDFFFDDTTYNITRYIFLSFKFKSDS